MRISPFLLDRWLDEHHFSTPPIEHDLAASTGPIWTLRELLSLIDPDEREQLFDAPVYYAPGDGDRRLREAIAGMAGVSPDEVQITTGAQEALWILFLVAAEPGANVVVPAPGFPPFSEVPRLLGLEVRPYRLRPESGYRADPDDIAKLLDRRTRLLIVNTPQNPTGAVASDEELDALHDLAAERGVQLVVDEVYHPIYHGRASASASRLSRTTVLGDFSKALCLGGLRLGWIVERDRARMEAYRDARTYLTVSSSPLSEALALAAVRNRETILARARKVAGTNLAFLDGFFAEHADRLGWVRPQGGMTAFPWLRSGEDSRSFCREAAARGVLLAPGDCFGTPSHFRLGFAVTTDGFPTAIGKLAPLLA